jgi:hypothetical protein
MQGMASDESQCNSKSAIVLQQQKLTNFFLCPMLASLPTCKHMYTNYRDVCTAGSWPIFAVKTWLAQWHTHRFGKDLCNLIDLITAYADVLQGVAVQ